MQLEYRVDLSQTSQNNSTEEITQSTMAETITTQTVQLNG